jgi:hypothetical protein
MHKSGMIQSFWVRFLKEFWALDTRRRFFFAFSEEFGWAAPVLE